MAVLSWPSFPGGPALAILPWLSCPGDLVPAIPSRQSRRVYFFLGCLVLAVLSWLSFPGCPFLAVLSLLSFPGRPTLAILFRLFCPGSPGCVPALLSGRPVLAPLSCQSFLVILFRLSFPGYPFLVVLFWPFCSGCPLPVVLFWPFCSGCPLPVVLSWLSSVSCQFQAIHACLLFPGRPFFFVLAVFFGNSCPGSPFGSPVLSLLSCSCFSVLIVLFWLSFPSCPHLAVLS
jgi:hypothetical protein